ncbi:MAG: hypothetical protein V4726_09275 [Verrucomicrobiota bacterium]
MDIDHIATLPPGFTEALTLVTAVDEALMHGLSRLPESVRESLDTLSGTLSGSPLSVVVAEAVEQVKRSEFSVSACLGLAAARSALLGAAADALRAPLYPEDASGAAAEGEASAFPAGNHAPLLSGVQQWLTELAVAGFAQLTEAQLTPFARVLTQLQAVEELAGQAALLSGFLDELILSNQQKEREGLPARRWADLWSAAMLGAQGLDPEPVFQVVNGTLHPCGVDVRAHRSFVQATLWGLLENADGCRVVRWPFVSWKVSVLTPDENWRLFGESAQRVLAVLAAGEALEITQAELSAAGDLRVTGEVKSAGPGNLFTLPAPWQPLPPPRAAARHPAHLAELIRLEKCKIDGGTVTCGNLTLPLALDRLEGVPDELDEKLLPLVTGMIGLLRWDEGGWRLQPLALAGTGKLKNGLRIGQGIAARLAKLKTETLTQLEERASRLLRA